MKSDSSQRRCAVGSLTKPFGSGCCPHPAWLCCSLVVDVHPLPPRRRATQIRTSMTGTAMNQPPLKNTAAKREPRQDKHEHHCDSDPKPPNTRASVAPRFSDKKVLVIPILVIIRKIKPVESCILLPGLPRLAMKTAKCSHPDLTATSWTQKEIFSHSTAFRPLYGMSRSSSCNIPSSWSPRFS